MQNDKEDWVHFTAVVKETAADEKNLFSKTHVPLPTDYNEIEIKLQKKPWKSSKEKEHLSFSHDRAITSKDAPFVLCCP